MIKHHPDQDLLFAHAKGELSLSMAIAISAHCALCEACKTAVAQYTQEAADLAFNQHEIDDTTADNIDISANDISLMQSALPDELQTMLAQILCQPELATAPSNEPILVSVKNQHYSVPSVFRQHLDRPWQQLGKVSRMRFTLNEMNTRASLLHIEALGEIPQHTHKGNELTLLLAGEFSDINGNYVPGDFIMLDGHTKHAPKTLKGCLCYIVLDAPLHFTKGLSKLLNPIGELIY
ncbi:ChrR family anti-sigma-E factor [Shewanella profunda]|uniref:ChrR family anti-sigma-E factor n=1 Tax=Shewanella profunda TaxID=254793 RepID=UPI00200FC3E7|nr:ChrR family anti-sigma-E factor [Shewanella profunda]MCL1091328.1 ChrR family anti-sigma-E factor [Shewanella profunda]